MPTPAAILLPEDSSAYHSGPLKVSPNSGFSHFKKPIGSLHLGMTMGGHPNTGNNQSSSNTNHEASGSLGAEENNLKILKEEE